jgi:alkanesulfonate monooxygenase SsuD/methylene tetrahydromethanopterin reductase-like flavin-dependent oxidoreductase (luciferase family)
MSVQQQVKVGVSVHETFLTPDAGERRRILDQVVDCGLDQVTMGDHISFHGGTGFDGLLGATSILSTHERVNVLVGIYLLGLRHPMVVSRQLATLSQIAPGRLVLGVGVGGEDRKEVSNAGVDPATRGRRLDEPAAVASTRPSGWSAGWRAVRRSTTRVSSSRWRTHASCLRPSRGSPSSSAEAATWRSGGPRGTATAGSASSAPPGGSARPWSGSARRPPSDRRPRGSG